jgi:hypothetical protein
MSELKKGPYLLKFWGKDQEEIYSCSFFSHILKELSLTSLKHDGCYYIWSDSEFDMNVIEHNLKQLCRDNNWKIVTDKCMQGINEYGVMVYPQYRTVATMVFVLPDGKRQDYVYDFGYGYPKDSAMYMFEDGNYSCDCNRSLFLSRIGVDIEELNCGDTIQMENLQINYL